MATAATLTGPLAKADAGAARAFDVHVDIRPEPDPGLLATRLQEALDALYETIP